MMTRPRTLLPALAASALVLAGCASGGAPTSAADGERTILNVFAAASLTEAFGALEKTFESGHPNVDVVLNLAGSQDLVAQMAANSGADVLATANESTMADAVSRGLVGEPRVFATNTLALITPAGNPAGVTGLDSSLSRAKLVICAPEVPCGALTAQLAEARGVRLDPASEEQAVTDVRGKVSSGEADAGIVYRTDALAAGDAVETIPIAGTEAVAAVYPIAVAIEAVHPDPASAWVDLVLSDAGQRVLGAAGFTPAAQ
ncbi:molybdate transport system substrate-binding protein [Schaalia hyovaginalis]|uniref:Molybdate transport system substrate-binding protein n=2 Tax=Schaalia hyovaginalis TaxID=29316 RepID=A0A923E3E6_9ACTO|nr:molybdate transport system substrate-binding protein [Schaalia hyovaginalis]